MARCSEGEGHSFQGLPEEESLLQGKGVSAGVSGGRDSVNRGQRNVR